MSQAVRMSTESRRRRASFDNVSDVYNRVRPGYPPELFDDLFGLLPARPSVLEVGPGTGQATRDLLRHGASVHAIEIGPAMAKRLRQELESRALTVTVGDFEQVPSGDDNAYDAVLGDRVPLDRAEQTARPARSAPQTGRSGGDRRSHPSQVRQRPGLLRCRTADLRQVWRGTQGSTAAAGRAESTRRCEHDSRRTGASRSWPFGATTGTRPTAPPSIDNSCSPTPALKPCSPPRGRASRDIEKLVREHFRREVTRPLVVTLTTATLAAKQPS